MILWQHDQDGNLWAVYFRHEFSYRWCGSGWSYREYWFCQLISWYLPKLDWFPVNLLLAFWLGMDATDMIWNLRNLRLCLSLSYILNFGVFIFKGKIISRNVVRSIGYLLSKIFLFVLKQFMKIWLNYRLNIQNKYPIESEVVELLRLVVDLFLFCCLFLCLELLLKHAQFIIQVVFVNITVVVPI